MLTDEQNARLTQVGPGTPMGELLRRYWHPVAPSSQLSEPGTRLIRALGEELVLYRVQLPFGVQPAPLLHRRHLLHVGDALGVGQLRLEVAEVVELF